MSSGKARFSGPAEVFAHPPGIPYRGVRFTAHTSTNSSGLPSSSRCSCVQSSRPVLLSAKGTYRSTLSITVTLRPPCLRAFYGFPAHVVNPVTIEPQHLEDGGP